MRKKQFWLFLVLATGVWGLFLAMPQPASAKATQAVTWYQQWRRTYVGGKTQKYVRANDGQGATTAYSEGQGYGMLAAVLAAKQGANTHATFNQFYRYYRAHRVASKVPLMAWRQTMRHGKLTSVGSEKNSATDGDLDIAYALILADKRWGSRQTNYRQAAKSLLAAIYKREINPTTKLPLMGNWATSAYDQSKVRTSDLVPGYFKVFAKFTKNKGWQAVATRSQKLIKKLSARHKTGLFPDFIRVTGTGLALTAVKAYEIESATDNQVGYNANRVPWRLAQSYQLTKNATIKRALTKQLTFFKKRQKVLSGYTLSGRAVQSYGDAAFVAPVNVAARVLKQTSLKKRTGKQLPKTIQKKNYYSGTLQMLCALS